MTEALGRHCDNPNWPPPSTAPVFGLALCITRSRCPELTWPPLTSTPCGATVPEMRITPFYKDNTREMKERNAEKEMATFHGSQWQMSARISALNSQTKFQEAVTSIKQKPKAAQERRTARAEHRARGTENAEARRGTGNGRRSLGAS